MVALAPLRPAGCLMASARFPVAVCVVARRTGSTAHGLPRGCGFDPPVGCGHTWDCCVQMAPSGRVAEGSPPEHDRCCGVPRDLVLLGGEGCLPVLGTPDGAVGGGDPNDGDGPARGHGHQAVSELGGRDGADGPAEPPVCAVALPGGCP